MKFRHFLFLAAIGTLTACSNTGADQANTKTPEQVATDQAKANTQALLDGTPEWYLNPPKGVRGAIYSVSTAMNSDLQFAINQAVLLAEHGLAKRIATEISSFEASTTTNAGGSNSAVKEEQIEARVNAADLFGHEITKRVVIPDPKTGEFRVFIQAYLPAKAQADLLIAARKKDKDMNKIKDLEAYISSLDSEAKQ